MTLRIDRSLLSDVEATHLDNSRDYAKNRRNRNAATDRCINENARGEHGRATHGTLCLPCRETHRGHRLESTLGLAAYRAFVRESLRGGRTITEIAKECGCLA